MYRLTMLAADELLDGVVRQTMDVLSDRLAERLGVGREMIAAGQTRQHGRTPLLGLAVRR